MTRPPQSSGHIKSAPSGSRRPRDKGLTPEQCLIRTATIRQTIRASDGEESMTGKATVLKTIGLTLLFAVATAALATALWHPTSNVAAVAFGGTLVLLLYAA